MPQTSLKYRLIAMTISGASWSSFSSPITEVRVVTIYNTDIASELYFCTDAADASSIITIAGGASFSIRLSDKYARGFIIGDVIGFLKGSGEAPKISYGV